MGLKFKIQEGAANAFGYPVDINSEDIDNLSALMLKTVLDSHYFKDTFAHTFVFRFGNKLLVGNNKLNYVNNARSGIMDESYYSLNENEKNAGIKEYKKDDIDAIILSNHQKHLLNNLKEFIKNSHQLSQIINFFHDNPDTYYLAMALTSDRVFQDMTELDNEHYKSKYKIDTFGETANHPNKNNWIILDEVGFTGFSEISASDEKTLGANIDNLSTNNFKNFMGVAFFGDKSSGELFNYDFPSSISMEELGSAAGREKMEKESQKRREFLEKMMNNQYLKQGSSYKILKEEAQAATPRCEINEKLYNQLYLEQHKKEFINKIDKLLNEPSLEAYYDQFAAKMPKAFKKIHKQFPCLNNETSQNYKAPKMEISSKTPTDSRTTALKDLAEHEQLMIYDTPEQQLSLKQMELSSKEKITMNSQEKVIYAYNELEVMGAAYLLCDAQGPSNRIKETNHNLLWDLQGIGLANHFKENNDVNKQLIDKTLDHISQQQMIVSFPALRKQESPMIEMFKEAVKERDDVFVNVLDGGVDPYFYGLHAIQRTLYSPRSGAKETTINSDSLAYEEILDLQNDYTAWFNENIISFTDEIDTFLENKFNELSVKYEKTSKFQSKLRF